MQIEPNELHNISNPQNTTSPITTSQHGLLPDQQHAAGLRDHINERLAEPQSSDGSSGLHSDNAEEQLSRLSVAQIGGTRPKPSFQQISEYEAALSLSQKKQNEGPIFKVVKTKGNRLDAVNLENCPNGKISLQFFDILVLRIERSHCNGSGKEKSNDFAAVDWLRFFFHIFCTSAEEQP